ncbi:unnamed protein product [Ranitomeya imitator]|uniref:Tyr recombinase domain-containing protein n=1 Tax=Ranitomeya imitator TaxID=111125 RepID=A0ABN9MIA6_9NEOB|nr:unnamed protein product [Ranitomeya imitator]
MQLYLQHVHGAAVARNRLCGLTFHFKLRGWEDVTKKNFSVRQALKGWNKSSEYRQSTKVVCSSVFESVLFSAAFGIAIFGAMRVSELVAPWVNKAGGLQQNVSFCYGCIRIRIRRSKTDQLGNGLWLPLFPITGPVCPITLFSEYLAIRPISQSFFALFDGAPLTRFQFLALLRRILEILNIPPEEYRTHSFRIGAATEAARAGLLDDVIMKNREVAFVMFLLLHQT